MSDSIVFIAKFISAIYFGALPLHTRDVHCSANVNMGNLTQSRNRHKAQTRHGRDSISCDKYII